MVLNGGAQELFEARDARGTLLVSEGGKPFWSRNLSDPELEALGSRFFPQAEAGYRRNRAVIQVIVGCRKNGSRAGIAQFVSSRFPGVEFDNVREMLDWLRGTKHGD